MHKLGFVAFTALALAACSRDEGAERTTNGGEQVTVESIGGNDVTAIDAATSSDANMAQDVEFNVEDLNALEEDGNAGASAGNSD